MPNQMPTEPFAPAPDVTGIRLVFADLPEALQPRESETDRAYCAFLLSCMQATRSNRKIGKAMGCGDANVRYWKNKFCWTRRRVTAQNSEWEALRAYRMLMDLQDTSTQVAALRVALDVVLDDTGFASLRHAVAAQRRGVQAGPLAHQQDPMRKAGTPAAAGAPAPAQERKAGKGTQDIPAAPKPPPDGAESSAGDVQAFRSPLSDDELEQLDVNEHYRRLREQVLTNHLRPEDVRRQIQLIDGTLGLIARKVASGELEVKVSDIPSLLKARAMLTGLPTEHIAVQSVHQHEHHVVVESARMRDARSAGEPAMLAAIQDELSELQVIVNAVPRTVIDVPAESPDV